MKLIILIIIFITFFQNLFSASNLEFERLNSNNGLSSEEIRDIFQDSDGYIWLLTNEGLNLYDGHDVKIYKPGEEGLNFTSSAFECICEDHLNRLWLGTNEKGLLIFDKNKHSVMTFEEFSEGKKILDNHIRSLLADYKGNIWIGTEFGLYKFHVETKDLTFYNLANPDSEQPAWCIIESILEDETGMIWIGTWNLGLMMYNPETKLFKSFNIFDKSQTTINDNRIKSIFEDNYNNIWIGTWEDGLYQVYILDGELKIARYFLYEDNNPNTLLGDIIYSINQDNNDNLWVGTPYGLTIIEDVYSNNPLFIRYTYTHGSNNGLSNNELWKIFKDKSGLMWLGTLEGGVNKVHPFGKIFEGYTIPPISSQIHSQTVMSFCTDSDRNLLIGVKSLGFGIYDLELNNYIHYSTLSVYNNLPRTINTVNCFLIENSRYLWLGTRYSGLIVFDYENSTFINMNEISNSFTYEAVNTLFYGHDQTVWAGTENGLYKISRCNGESICYIVEPVNNISGSRITSVIEDGQNNIWVGTAENGVNIIQFDKNLVPDIRVFDKESINIPTNRIQYLYKDSRNNIWIGSSDEGLLKYDPNTDLIIATEIFKDLRTDAVFSISEDESGSLWLTTNNGLTRLIIEDENTITDNYTVTDGLLGNIFIPGSMSRIGSRIFIGSYYGFNSFRPTDVIPNNYLAPTLITEVRINDEIYHYDSKLSESILLKYNQNNLTFQFSAMSFFKTEKNIYSYKLDGFNDNWQFVDANIRSAQFSNLDAGNYTFLVKSANSSELWNNDPVFMEFEILPAPYRTWWAYLGYAVIFGFILISGYRFLLKNEKIKQAYEIEKIEHAKSEKLNQFKLRFFTNISHELLTPVSIVSCAVEIIKSKTRKSKNELIIVERNINQLNRLLNQLLDYRKMESGHLKLNIEKGNFSGHLEQVVMNFSPIAQKGEITLNFIKNGTERLSYFDADKVDKILHNLISNALKFTPKGGYILIQSNIIIKNGNLCAEVTVSDTGKGIPEDDMENIFKRFYRAEIEKEGTGTGIGLALTKSLVELHKGEIAVASEIDKGTTFKLLLPIYKDAFGINEMSAIQKESKSGDISTDSFEVIPGTKSIKKFLPAGSRIKLLLVDDNSDFRNLLKVYFSKTYEVIEASDGEQGLKKAVQEQPDIIVSDVIMPHKDGYELCLDLKNNIDTKYIPVILLTAKAAEHDRSEGYSVGADSYITKPLSIQVLESRINALLMKRYEMMPFQKQETIKDANSLKLSDDKFIKRIKDYVLQNISDSEISTMDLYSHLGMSNSTFYRRLKQLTKLSPVEFIKRIRLNEAASMLKKGNANIAEVAYSTGFSDQSYFTACFKKHFGLTPSNYVKIKIRKPKLTKYN